MKKIFLIGSFLIAGCIGANAQFDFGIGVNIGLPVGHAGDLSSFTIGGEVQGEYKFSETVSGIATTAYTYFVGKIFQSVKLSFGAVPILAGARFYPSEKFFAGGQIGYGFFTGDANGGGFAYKPQVGYDSRTTQVSLSYTAITQDGTIGWIALSAVFKFHARTE